MANLMRGGSHYANEASNKALQEGAARILKVLDRIEEAEQELLDIKATLHLDAEADE